MAEYGATRAERQVVDLAIALIDGSDPRLLAPRLLREVKPTGLNPAAMEAIEIVLSRGVARQVVEGGGLSPWKGAKPLSFGSATLDLLSWLYSSPIASPSRKPLKLRSKPTPAEGLLLATVTSWLSALGAEPLSVAAGNPWVWLLAGSELAGRVRPAEDPGGPDFREVAENLWLLDALAPRMKAALLSWSRVVRSSAVAETTAHGESQELVYSALLRVLPPDHTLFVAQALVELSRLDLGVWEIERGNASVSQWQRARRARVAFVRAVSAWLVAFEQRLRSVGFIDDGFDAAQRDLRRFGEAFLAVRRLAPAVARAEEMPI